MAYPSAAPATIGEAAECFHRQSVCSPLDVGHLMDSSSWMTRTSQDKGSHPVSAARRLGNFQ